MTVTDTASTTSVPKTQISNQSRLHIIDTLWRMLAQPWLPVICAVLLLLTVIAAFILPQLPSQLSEDPAAAARWISDTATDYGTLGSALSGLGLFRAMNSLLWRLLAVLLGTLLPMHLLRLWLLDRQMVAATKMLTAAANDEHSVLPLPPAPALYRDRRAVGTLPDVTAEQLQEKLRIQFDTTQLVQQPFLVKTEESSSTEEGESAPEENPVLKETRILAMRGRRELRLRMVLLAGGIIAAVALWWLNIFGWRILSDPLTPLERFRDDWHNVAIDFRLEENSPVIVAQQNGERIEIATPIGNQSVRAGTVHTFAGPPALLIQSLSPGAELKRPDGASSTGVGLLFPAPGSEETLIMPQQETVLRIVRQTDAEPLTFTIEAIQADATNRFGVAADETRTLTLGADEVQLRFLPLYSRQIEMTSLPGMWLLWLALPLTLLGLAGLRKSPGFALVQITPWPHEHSVVVTQSSESSSV